MEPLIYVMAIMGCADGGAACNDIRAVPVAYRSKAQCMVATQTQLLVNSDLPYPVIQAECRARGVQTASRVVRPRG